MYGEKHAELLSHHRGVARVAEMVFGGGKGGKPNAGPVKDLAAGHKSAEDAATAINAALLSG